MPSFICRDSFACMRHHRSPRESAPREPTTRLRHLFGIGSVGRDVMNISNITWIIGIVLAVYGLVMGVFIISENRSPQATLAWMLAFILVPGLGVLVYFLFGRDTKAFSRQSTLLRQELAANALPVLARIVSSQDTAIEQLGGESVNRRRLLRLVRHNSLSALTQHNQVEIQQDATKFYSSLMDDMRRARHSIHLQYFIWGADSF